MKHYRERLWPAAWLYITTALVIPASLLVFLPIDPTVGWVVAVVLYLGSVGTLLATSPVIEVTDNDFIAGRARLPLAIIGATSGHFGEDARAERGPLLDSRAWLMIRGWVSPVVKVQLLDANDPAPYWIVSTRHPEALLAAIESAQSAHQSRQ